jgi:acetate kinase
MRTLIGSDDPAAAEAVDLFVYRIGREIGSLAAAMGGLDTLVFTAGIGENAPLVRKRICVAAAWLGVGLDEKRNREGEEVVSNATSRVDVIVIPADEESAVAAEMLVFRSAAPTTARKGPRQLERDEFRLAHSLPRCSNFCIRLK